MTLRETPDLIVEIDKKKYLITKRENFSKRDLYRSAIMKCCHPNCVYGLELEVHHIIPIKNGGTDTFDNFIVLCSKCHRRNRLHSKWSEKRLSLYAYKIYVEDSIISKNSADYSDEEYWKVLKNFCYNSFHPVKTLKEEGLNSNVDDTEGTYINSYKRMRDEEFE